MIFTKNIDLRSTGVFDWIHVENVRFKGYLLDSSGTKLSEKEMYQIFSNIGNLRDFSFSLKDLNGCYSIVIINENEVFAACDPIRTFPLFYKIENNNILITDNLSLEKHSQFGLKKDKIDELNCGRYVLGEHTIFEKTKGIEAGQAVSFIPKATKIKYSSFNVPVEKKESSNVLKKQFKNVLDKVSQNLINSINPQSRIVIPLSSGYDSRLIASLLKIKGFQNVLCFTYGEEKSKHVQISRKVASKLGFDWTFVNPMKSGLEQNYIYSSEFKRYCDFAFNGVSLPVIQDYLIIKQLKESNTIKETDIIVPGHSGDMLVGNHLYYPDYTNHSKDYLIKSVLKRHFILNKLKFRKKTEQSIANYYKEDATMYSMIDNYNLNERQAKYIVNSLRVYEYFGFEHRMPLWDQEIYTFFKNLDFQNKFNSKFYIEYIFENIFKKLNIAFVPPDKIQKNKSKNKRLKILLPYEIQQFLRLNFKTIKSIDKTNANVKIYTEMMKDTNKKFTNINGIFANWLISSWQK